MLQPFSPIRPAFTAAMIIPTGIGASIGGFAGDATPALNLLASVTDTLITHPNVANAAVFQKLPENALYVEGYGLDQFMLGRWGLRPVRKNRIGVVFDTAIGRDMRILHENTINAVRSVYGVEVVGAVETDEPVETACVITDSGCSSGTLRNPETILAACRQLLDQGADAIALCVQLPELSEADEIRYRTGSGADPIGGIEGILSHLVVSELSIPCAHAPVFPWEKATPVTDEVVDPRAAAEYITPTFLPCVLTGLSRAPQFEPLPNVSRHTLTVADLNALIVPASALGGIPVLAALSRNIPVIAVQANQTALSVDVSCFKQMPPSRRNLIHLARSYEEAVGILQTLRLGLSLPGSVCAS
ncbi:MAG TPA: DUF3326 domain-containing protein [Oculatellaceae cyanobacterium]|jgi:hypothetical protein